MAGFGRGHSRVTDSAVCLVGAMLHSTDVIPILHRLAVAAFVGVTSVSMLVAVLSRLRVPRPRIVWRRSGPLTRIPLGPLLFLLVAAGGIGHAWMTGRTVPLYVLVGYPAGGAFWFLATWMVRSVVVTEYGIVPDVRRVHRAVVWSQIVDYFVRRKGGSVEFVFFCRGEEGERHRFELPVPKRHALTFRRLVERKLAFRFRVASDEGLEPDELPQLGDGIDLS